MTACSAAGLTHTLAAAEPVIMASAEKILFDLIPDSDDQLLPFSFGDQLIEKYCTNHDLKMSDLSELRIGVASLGAIIEVANLVMGAKDQRKGKLRPVIFCIFFIFDIQAPNMQR